MSGIKSAFIALLALVTFQAQAQNAFEDPDLRELEQQKQKALEQVNTLNQLNPLNPAAVTNNPIAGGATGEAGKIDVSKLPPQLQWVVPMLQNEQVQKKSRAFVGIAQDSAFQKNADLIMKNPNLNWMFGGFVVVFVLYLLIKSRVLAASDRFLVRMMLRLVLVPVLFGGLFLVAYGVLGQPIIEVMMIAARGMLQS